MPKRVSILPEEGPVRFFSSGCALLDCVLGGGWGLGKVINIVGDKSTGKTLLAIEASANFVRAYGRGEVTYIEAESAFDPTYARTIGVPADRFTLLPDLGTIEAVWRKVDEVLKAEPKAGPQLVIIDSLDALTDEAEVERDFGAASMGMAKAKALSEGFRKLVRKMGAGDLTLMVISQVRDRIGVTFGKQVTRSGGHALDFYASQVLWLYEEGKIKKTVAGLERAVGLTIKARCEKNRLGWPWRECVVPIIYGYGVEDVQAALDWGARAAPERLGELGEGITANNYKRHLSKLDRGVVGGWVAKVWEEVDKQFRPEKRKYD